MNFHNNINQLAESKHISNFCGKIYTEEELVATWKGRVIRVINLIFSLFRDVDSRTSKLVLQYLKNHKSEIARDDLPAIKKLVHNHHEIKSPCQEVIFGLEISLERHYPKEDQLKINQEIFPFFEELDNWLRTPSDWAGMRENAASEINTAYLVRLGGIDDRDEEHMRRWTTLDLKMRFLHSLPKCIDKLTHIETLELSDNCFKTLPRSITSLTNLKEINIHHNQHPLRLEFERKELPADCKINYTGTLFKN